MKLNEFAVAIGIILSPNAAHASALPIIFEKDPTALVTRVRVLLDCGSIDDPVGKYGLTDTSLLMLSQSTKKHSRDDMNTQLEGLGGATNFEIFNDHARLDLNVLSENFEPAIQLFSESILQPAIDRADLKIVKEQQSSTIQNETSDFQSQIVRIVTHVLKPNSPYEHGLTGKIKDVASIDENDVKNGLATCLSRPLTFLVSSNLDQPKVEALIQSVFAKLQPDRPFRLAPAPGAEPTKNRLVFVPRLGSPRADFRIITQGIAAANPNRIALEVGNAVLGTQNSSRLFQELRAKLGWVYIAYSDVFYVDPPENFVGESAIKADPKPEVLAKATAHTVEFFKKYIQKGITQKEMDSAKESLRNDYAFNFATPLDRFSRKEQSIFSGFEMPNLAGYREKLKTLSLNQVNEAIRTTYEKQPLTVLILADPKWFDGVKQALPDFEVGETVDFKSLQ